MNIKTGEIKQQSEISSHEKHDYVEIKRDLTEVEKSEKQIQLYSTCGCGSGKKFKFCCYKKFSV